MTPEIIAALDVAIKQAPNLLFALLAFAYLARQNNAVLSTMREVNERQFELIQKLCSQCLQDHKPS